MDGILSAGLDIGSTTAKLVILGHGHRLLFSSYKRHRAKTVETARAILGEALQELGDVEIDLAVTGSAGKVHAGDLGLPFVQEVVASAGLVQRFYPEVRTLIEIGGEDSKIVFFDDDLRPELRMNGSCAGGTGAFIDQMASLLDVEVEELDAMARHAACTYPIASRCGVFAKTDVQALLSRKIPVEDIAASIFRSVALQVVTALARGRSIETKILLGGGPLTFYRGLREALREVLGIQDPGDMFLPPNAELLPAIGTAMTRGRGEATGGLKISDLLGKEASWARTRPAAAAGSLPALFKDKEELESWKSRHAAPRTPRLDPAGARGKDLFLGIDSGSTTTKLVLVDREGRLVAGHYRPNHGDPIGAVKKGIARLRDRFASLGFSPRIAGACATGYGEGLVRAAFGLHHGVVETLAHYRAARRFEPEVSFILDIGGQDMKAVTIRQGTIAEIQVNEACSSGCGTFIETFARTLGCTVEEFAEMACTSTSPFDLGTRCTVFMNSKVKEALRRGASIPDISAGLAYSVIKNALHKVLKIKEPGSLGEKILVQGGTFRNHAVLRALERLLGKEVTRPDISELMGAYGAALTAISNHREAPARAKGPLRLEDLGAGADFTKSEVRCNGCENRCRVSRLSFENGNRFYTGNRCERHFGNEPDAKPRGTNLIREQLRLLFQRETEPEGRPRLTYGIPRCLNVYDDFPFWCTFLTSCGFRVVLSSPSDFKLYEKGASTVMSENICFPAKLVHGHVLDLLEKEVDRIFYPTVVFGFQEFPGALNSYNCPVVTGYPDLIKNAADPLLAKDIPLDSPAISFKDLDLLKDQLHLFFKRFGLNRVTVSQAVERGLEARKHYLEELRTRAEELLATARREKRTVVVLAGRPYHLDPLVNHGIPNLLARMGVDVVSENAVCGRPGDPLSLEDLEVLPQWTYTNRLYAAAKWAARHPEVQLVHLTSFGCGPDAISTDEMRHILGDAGKMYTLIKVDEMANLGAVKIRLRSMLEALGEDRPCRPGARVPGRTPARRKRVFTRKDRARTLIAPYFSPFYSPLLPAAFKPLGYRLEVLPPQDDLSVEPGLRAVNNDMCYPAVIVAGDILKAFKTGGYDPSGTAVILTQTGGQCRASSYVPLVRKGLESEGLGDVPVVALADGDMNPQPGFEIDERGLTRRLALGLMFTDPLARLYLATVAREKTPGTAGALHRKYLLEMEPGIENADYQYLLDVLKRAIEEFNRVETGNEHIPRIGVVGEIFVKYNLFANRDIIQWLSGQGIEVVLPPLQGFFTQRFINETFDQKALFKRCIKDLVRFRLLELYVNHYLGQIEKVMQGFRFFRRSHDLRHLSEATGQIVSLANQAGEGWLLTADMIHMASDGVRNIICLQPFGCISNHITGRGVEKGLKRLYPGLNILSLDMDAGTSEVNMLNRLHLLVTEAKRDPDIGKAAGERPAINWKFLLQRPWPLELEHALGCMQSRIGTWRPGRH